MDEISRIAQAHPHEHRADVDRKGDAEPLDSHAHPSPELDAGQHQRRMIQPGKPVSRVTPKIGKDADAAARHVLHSRCRVRRWAQAARADQAAADRSTDQTAGHQAEGRGGHPHDGRPVEADRLKLLRETHHGAVPAGHGDAAAHQAQHARDMQRRREPHADQILEHRKCQRQAEKQHDLQRATLDQRPARIQSDAGKERDQQRLIHILDRRLRPFRRRTDQPCPPTLRDAGFKPQRAHARKVGGQHQQRHQ